MHVYRREFCQLGIVFERLTKDVPEDTRANYGFRLLYGLLPHTDKAKALLADNPALLEKEPNRAEDLKAVMFTKRKHELLSFPDGVSGTSFYAAACYENAKGQKGPFGPIFQADIP
jgi:hypothetical protein